MNAVYPVLVSTLLVAMNVSFEGMDFKVVPYHTIQQDKTLKPAHNHNIRKSQQCLTPMPILSGTSTIKINNYFAKNKIDLQYANATDVWKVLRYNQTGLFIEHRDSQHTKEGFKHFGTQIYLPPRSQVNFQGGELLIWENGKIHTVTPHATQWTHIIMPLGILHKVNKIKKGTRVSYVKPIFGVGTQANTEL